MRVAIAGISHETNSYCAELTPAEAFWTLRGERVMRARQASTDVGGMLVGLEEIGAEPVPLLVAGASPSGVIERRAYDGFKDEILEGLRTAGAIDAVALSMHGAGVVRGIDDLEGDLACAVRELVGARVPVVASFDLHGNVSQRMADALDLTLACHHYPHTDMYERGLEAVRHLPALISGELAPVSWVESVPMLMPTSTTLFGPAREVLEHCLSLEAGAGVIDVSFFHGFPYTDTPLVGSHIVVTTRDDPALARRIAQQGARYLWERREAFRPKSLSCEQAIEHALAVAGRPVVINETSDNPGGGAPGDGTHLLRAMLDAGLEDACFGFIVDPEAAATAHAAGVGAQLELELGARSDELHGAPLRVSAYVKTLSDGRFRWQAMMKGVQANLGPMARLRVDGVDVIVATGRQQTFDPEPFLAVGIDPARYKIVALKSSNHFRAGFQELAAEIVTADPPGLTTHHIEVFPRHRNGQPLWPLDTEAQYEPRKD